MITDPGNAHGWWWIAAGLALLAIGAFINRRR